MNMMTVCHMDAYDDSLSVVRFLKHGLWFGVSL